METRKQTSGEEGATWRHCGAAFNIGTVTECLKCQARSLSGAADGVRGTVTARTTLTFSHWRKFELHNVIIHF